MGRIKLPRQKIRLTKSTKSREISLMKRIKHLRYVNKTLLSTNMELVKELQAVRIDCRESISNIQDQSNRFLVTSNKLNSDNEKLRLLVHNLQAEFMDTVSKPLNDVIRNTSKIELFIREHKDVLYRKYDNATDLQTSTTDFSVSLPGPSKRQATVGPMIKGVPIMNPVIQLQRVPNEVLLAASQDGGDNRSSENLPSTSSSIRPQIEFARSTEIGNQSQPAQQNAVQSYESVPIVRLVDYTTRYLVDDNNLYTVNNVVTNRTQIPSYELPSQPVMPIRPSTSRRSISPFSNVSSISTTTSSGDSIDITTSPSEPESDHEVYTPSGSQQLLPVNAINSPPNGVRRPRMRNVPECFLRSSSVKENNQPSHSGADSTSQHSASDATAAPSRPKRVIKKPERFMPGVEVPSRKITRYH